jgi:hypothetical protein
MPSHLTTLFQRYLEQKTPQTCDVKQMFDLFFQHLYPDSSGGVQSLVFQAILDHTRLNPTKKDQVVLDVCNRLGYSTTEVAIHPFSLRSQSESDVTPVFEWLDRFFSENGETPYGPYLHLDAWSRETRYWWSDLLEGMGANRGARFTDFAFAHFGTRFGQAVAEIVNEHVTSQKPLHSIGLCKRLTSVFERVDDTLWQQPAFWEACLSQLPGHPFLFSLVFARGAPTPIHLPQPDISAWISRQVDACVGKNPNLLPTVLSDVTRKSQTSFSSWDALLTREPSLSTFVQRLLQHKSEAANKLIDKDHFQRCIVSLENTLLRSQHQSALATPSPTAPAL